MICEKCGRNVPDFLIRCICGNVISENIKYNNNVSFVEQKPHIENFDLNQIPIFDVKDSFTYYDNSFDFRDGTISFCGRNYELTINFPIINEQLKLNECVDNSGLGNGYYILSYDDDFVELLLNTHVFKIKTEDFLKIQTHLNACDKTLCEKREKYREKVLLIADNLYSCEMGVFINNYIRDIPLENILVPNLWIQFESIVSHNLNFTRHETPMSFATPNSFMYSSEIVRAINTKSILSNDGLSVDIITNEQPKAFYDNHFIPVLNLLNNKYFETLRDTGYENETEEYYIGCGIDTWIYALPTYKYVGYLLLIKAIKTLANEKYGNITISPDKDLNIY